MFRSVMIRGLAAVVLLSLGCTAQTAGGAQKQTQDNTQIQSLDGALSPAQSSAPSQNTGTNQAPAGNAPAQNTNNNQASPPSTPAQSTNTTQKAQKSTKASKKSRKATNPIADVDSKQP